MVPVQGWWLAFRGPLGNVKRIHKLEAVVLEKARHEAEQIMLHEAAGAIATMHEGDPTKARAIATFRGQGASTA
jgi:hypothetical protein